MNWAWVKFTISLAFGFPWRSDIYSQQIWVGAICAYFPSKVVSSAYREVVIYLEDNGEGEEVFDHVYNGSGISDNEDVCNRNSKRA